MLAPGGEFHAPSPLADAALRSLKAYPDFIRELEQESSWPIDFRRSGAVEVAFNDVEAAALSARSEGQRKLGIRSEPFSHNGYPARYYSDDAVVNPRDVTEALLRACRRRGVIIHEREAVLEISARGERVRTTASQYATPGVVIAAGAWSSSLRSDLPRTMPVRGHLISWALEPGRLEPILRRGHTYLLQRRTGVLIAGASTEHVGFERCIDETAVADIQTGAAALLPALGHLEPGERWNGFRPGIEAEGPAVGILPGTCIWTAFGHYRNGILLAPETASQITAAIP
jgi:glycine/D-amino acid oxidase-like deaminating enzyme